MKESVTALCGPKGRHGPQRLAVRDGSEDGSVTLGGRRVPVRRPCVHAADGSKELPMAAYDLIAGTDLLGERAMARMAGQVELPALLGPFAWKASIVSITSPTWELR